ncbi:MAG: Gfo/Idh/MocA family oxidoreductase [Verrucomicrobiales bacterium]
MSIRVGVIGYSEALPHHLRGFRGAGAEVVARVSQQGAELLPDVSEVCDGVGQLLDREDLDAIIVDVSESDRAAVITEALQAGKHVFASAPPAIDAMVTEEVYSVYQAIGTTLMFDFFLRADDSVRALESELRGDAFSGLSTIKIEGKGHDAVLIADLGLYLLGLSELEHMKVRLHQERPLKVTMTARGVPSLEISVTHAGVEGDVRIVLENEDGGILEQVEIPADSMASLRETAGADFIKSLICEEDPISVPEDGLRVMQLADQWRDLEAQFKPHESRIGSGTFKSGSI